jgi:hypothetical protein
MGETMAEHEDGSLSEITILPDGRVYVFGMTLPLLETLAALPTRDGRWQALLDRLRAAAPSAADQEAPCE